MYWQSITDDFSLSDNTISILSYETLENLNYIVANFKFRTIKIFPLYLLQLSSANSLSKFRHNIHSLKPKQLLQKTQTYHSNPNISKPSIRTNKLLLN